MIILEQNSLEFSFPDVHSDARCTIDLQRTLRIPDDNHDYPLPPGLGRFPLKHVDDYKDQIPANWVNHGGIFFPMYQSEALWLNFHGSYPCAVKVAAGKINAVTGEQWHNELVKEPQDYLVIPGQPWLDGFSVGEGLIRQFVAMPLGKGYTAEEQLTGEAEHGGIQIIVYPMKAEFYNPPPQFSRRMADEDLVMSCLCEDASMEMGLAPGGVMRQEIYEDTYGFKVWDQSASSRCFVHIVNSVHYLDITGELPPTEPPTAKDYEKAGLPWFEYFDAEKKILKGAAKLAGIDSVASKVIKKGLGFLPGNEAVKAKQIKNLGPSAVVREGNF